MGHQEPPRREKRSVRKTVNLPPSIALAVAALGQHEGRTYSTVIKRILEKDPSVQIFIQRIEGREGRS
jgi:hypothetical protein